VEISQGKQLSVGQHQTRIQPPSSTSANGQSTKSITMSGTLQSNMQTASQFTLNYTQEKAKSLNILLRKQENERIERENHGLAKRLYENGGHIQKKKLDKEY
jgi:hypothetical protein